MGGVVVVGSANLDHRLTMPELPGVGQTVLSTDYALAPGGKGANQAVAAARAGARTRMVAALGEDTAGQRLLAALRESGVDTASVRVSPKPTGAAFVMVDQRGENQIVVAPGANFELGAADLDRGLAELGPGDFVLLQLEVPGPLIEAAIFTAHRRGARVMLNVSPVLEQARSFLAVSDVLVVNYGELIEVAGMLGMSIDADAPTLATALATRLQNVVVCTLGAGGALAATREQLFEQIAPAVAAVDTTGAGDTFTGYLAAGLAGGQSVAEALSLAVKASAQSVTKPGAIPAIPHLADLG
ncbi:MAG: ribokinase [Propionibacteriaceae bacterium]|jgi:ribokinase|nr:ribokinase [Propionibacteriaceae bacterium]